MQEALGRLAHDTPVLLFVGSEAPAGFPGVRGAAYPGSLLLPPREQRGDESSRLPLKLACPPRFKWASQKQ